MTTPRIKIRVLTGKGNAEIQVKACHRFVR